jgi:hypothetical protein
MKYVFIYHYQDAGQKHNIKPVNKFFKNVIEFKFLIKNKVRRVRRADNLTIICEPIV